MIIQERTQRLYLQTSGRQTEIDFQMSANELYPTVKPAIIVGTCGQTGLVTSFIEHAIILKPKNGRFKAWSHSV